MTSSLLQQSSDVLANHSVEVDRWVSDWFHADDAFLEHFYATGDRLDPKSLPQPGVEELLTPLEIPEFTPQRWTSRCSF